MATHRSLRTAPAHCFTTHYALRTTRTTRTTHYALRTTHCSLLAAHYYARTTFYVQYTPCLPAYPAPTATGAPLQSLQSPQCKKGGPTQMAATSAVHGGRRSRTPRS